MKHKLVRTKLELESVKALAKEEKERTEKAVRHFLYLLKVALRERDEARSQLQTLMDKISSLQSQHSISNTPYSQLYASSSPTNHRLPNLTSNSGLPSQQYCGADSMQTDVIRSEKNMRDDYDDSLLYDGLIQGKPLPEKGRLLQAVIEAGPLLNTLVVAPLPNWKNPPPSTLPVLQDPISNFPTYSNFEIHHAHVASHSQRPPSSADGKARWSVTANYA